MSNPIAVNEAFNINGVWYQDYQVEVNGETEIKRYMHNGSDWVELPKKIDFTKRVKDTANGISLKKSIINLDKSVINLSKTSGVDLLSHCAKVAVVIDFSGSMRGLYRHGDIQNVLNRLLPLGLKFDDNGEIDIWLFHDGYRRLDAISLADFDGYVDNVIMRSGERFGCTSYAPVLQDVYRKYITEEPSDTPAFIIFITDGANDDKSHTDRIIRDLSYTNIFVQFIGIGNDEFKYLRKLDDLTGRPVDNTGFIAVNDMADMSDDELYTELLRQYISWLKDKKLV